MSSKEGGLTCTYDAPKPSSVSIKLSEQNFAVEIIEDILDKVDEISFDGLNDKLDYEKHEHDFEIVYPNDGDAKFGNVIVKINEFLDTIEENITDSVADNVTDADQSIDASDEMFHIIHDDGDDVIDDSDGMVTDKHLASQSQVYASDSANNICFGSDVTDSR